MKFKSAKVVAIGEAMVELAPVDAEHYLRGFAGDTFNTAWHMAQALGSKAQVGFVTKTGQDKLSDDFVAKLAQDGLDVSAIGRDADRTMGLYLIELDGVERSFHYWRRDSAARLLADDVSWLNNALEGVGLIHLSGITAAILAPEARTNLIEALSLARSQGARVSFDPNLRKRLWSSTEEVRETIPRFLKVTDIALPSYDDEQTHWDDTSVDATLERFAAAGVAEVVLKNGAGAVETLISGERSSMPTPSVTDIRDTSGAGDAFNAGYLAARIMGLDSQDAVRCAHQMSGEVIRHFGALTPKHKVLPIAPQVR